MLEQQVLNFVHANAILLFCAYVIFMAAVSNLPKPMPQDGRLYFWFYGTMHTLAVNLGQVAEAINARNIQKAALLTETTTGAKL